MAENKQKYLYLAVTNDEYELIIAHGATQKELAKQLGIDNSCISNALRRPGGNGKKSKRKIVRIEIDEEE